MTLIQAPQFQQFSVSRRWSNSGVIPRYVRWELHQDLAQRREL